MTKVLPKAETKELEELFARFDSNNDGEVNATELREIMRTLGFDMTEAELYDIIRTATIYEEKSLTLTFQEFLEMIVTRMRDIESDENLNQAFGVFDRGDHGFFLATDIRIVMQQLGELITVDESNILMALIDFDNSGAITINEFLNFMRMDIEATT